MRLRREEFEELLPILGDSSLVRFNHTSENCVGNSNAGKLWKDEHGKHFTCYRCGAWYHEPGLYSRSGYTGTTATINLPSDATVAISMWSIEAQAWIRNYIDDSALKRHRIYFSQRLNGIVFPVWHGDLVGYIVRCFNTGWPKYYTKTVNPQAMWVGQKRIGNDVAVVVEDYVSRVKILESPIGDEVDVYAALGTEFPEALKSKLMDYEHVVIWLDNDNQIVRDKAERLRESLELFGPVVFLVRGFDDPKNQSMEDIEAVIIAATTSSKLLIHH